MTAPSGTMLPVGARYCAVFALNSDGIIAATSTTPASEPTTPTATRHPPQNRRSRRDKR